MGLEVAERVHVRTSCGGYSFNAARESCDAKSSMEVGSRLLSDPSCQDEDTSTSSPKRNSMMPQAFLQPPTTYLASSPLLILGGVSLFAWMLTLVAYTEKTTKQQWLPDRETGVLSQW